MSLPQQILLFIEENGMVGKEALFRPSRFFHHEMAVRDEIARQMFYNTVGRLKREGYLEEIEENGKKKMKTTLMGKIKIFGLLKKEKQWDGKWRIVVFDIPEKERRMRNFFRKKLGDLGFRILQESVWISPYNIADKVEDLIELCQAKAYVHYLLVEELNDKNTLMELFNIKGVKSNKNLTTVRI